MKLDKYFEEEKIVQILCKYRAKEAGKRHDLHMIRNFSVHKRSNTIFSSQQKNQFKQISEMFPSRRKWKKLYRDERKSCRDSLKTNQLRLFNSYKRTKKEIELNLIQPPTWYNKLTSFVHEIQAEILDIESLRYDLSSPKITGIKKDEKDGLITYRPIAVYDLKSKIICSLTAKYFINFFDKHFLDCSYAFRAYNAHTRKIPSHHDCIDDINKKRKSSRGLWVAECDIQKFFDIVNHTHLLEVFTKLSKKIEVISGKAIDPKSVILFKSFLKSYSFQENILKLNNDKDWFEENNLPMGVFGWAEKKLNNAFGETYCVDNLLGVPQGNAISCFVANLILHDVDERVLDSVKDIFYIRYCDDMILLHSEKSNCQLALDAFTKGLKDNFLLYHDPVRNLNYKEESFTFWNESKSKLPYYWGDKNVLSTNVPWLSFVGYQINFDGKIRVRKKTIIKETKKQVAETEKVIANLGKLKHYQTVKNHHSRWSKRQIISSLEHRLISMSVGRIKIYNHKNPLQQGLCWTNGFKTLKRNRIVSKQLRYLDRRRNHQIIRLKNSLKKIVRKSTIKDFKERKNHNGSAFSYYNFLKYK